MGQVRDSLLCLVNVNVHEHEGANKIPFMGNPIPGPMDRIFIQTKNMS
jgi:hypothetical protein